MVGLAPRQSPPTLRDYPIVLQSGKGELRDLSPVALFTHACDDGWPTGCDTLGVMYLKGEGGVSRDPVKAAIALEKACNGRVATACSNVGFMHHSGDGIPRDAEKGLSFLQRSCELGYARGCIWLKEVRGGS
jgi:TPR repeat protein